MQTIKSFFLIFSLLLTFTLSAENPLVINPSNLFLILADCEDEASMVKICEGYRLTKLPSEEGYKVYAGEDGSTVRFKIDSVTYNKSVPVIEIETGQKIKDLKKSLEAANFKKKGNGYVRGTDFTPHLYLCNIKKGMGNKQNKITCTKIPSSKL